MKFEFATAQRILFGEGTLNEIGALALGFGRRALVVTGAHPARAQRLLTLLAASGVDATVF
ncbi:MAG: iron-containing alcohol dehydrogenase, partial [Caldilinea sp.]